MQMLAKDRIHAWFGGDEVQALVAFVKEGKGKQAYDQLRRDSTAAYPQYADELAGIALGAEVHLVHPPKKHAHTHAHTL